MLGFHALIVVGSSGIGEPVLILLLTLHVFFANALRYFVGAPMHCGLRSDVPDFRKSVRTITLDPLSEFLYWHMNWHLEHHMYAGVPFYNLKALHRAVADDMPAPRTLLGAWREMRAVRRHQREDPDYAYDTPVPSTGKGRPPRRIYGRPGAESDRLSRQSITLRRTWRRLVVKGRTSVAQRPFSPASPQASLDRMSGLSIS